MSIPAFAEEMHEWFNGTITGAATPVPVFMERNMGFYSSGSKANGDSAQLQDWGYSYQCGEDCVVSGAWDSIQFVNLQASFVQSFTKWEKTDHGQYSQFQQKLTFAFKYVSDQTFFEVGGGATVDLAKSMAKQQADYRCHVNSAGVASGVAPF